MLQKYHVWRSHLRNVGYTQTYLQLMNSQAQKAQQHLSQTGVLTVIVQDNTSVPRSKLTHEHFERWYSQGQKIVFLTSL